MGKYILAIASIAFIAMTAIVLAPDAFASVHHVLSEPIGVLSAMSMIPASREFTIPGARGILSVRADMTMADLVKQIEGINASITKRFEDMKAENTAALEAKTKDVVQTEKVDRINADITKLLKQQDELSQTLAAIKVGGAGEQSKSTAEERAYGKALYGSYMRKGVENGLGDLAVKASLQVQSDPDGGYLVLKETETTIDRIAAKVSVMRRLATVRNIGTTAYRKPITTTAAGSGGWVGETTARTESTNPKLSMLEFPAFELYAFPFTTQTLLDDAFVNIESWLADEVGIIFGEKEGTAFISGDGVTAPRGILSYSPAANASYAWGNPGYIASGAAADFIVSDSPPVPGNALISTVYALKATYRQNAAWIMNDATQARIRKFTDTTGQYLWQPSLVAGAPATLLGYPIEPDDNMSDIAANAYPIAFGDWKRAYIIVDRVGIRVLRDALTNKPYVGFYTTKRVGGGIQNFEALKLLKMAVS